MSVELVNLINDITFDHIMRTVISDPEIISNHPKIEARTQFYSKDAIDKSFIAYQDHHDHRAALLTEFDQLQDARQTIHLTAMFAGPEQMAKLNVEYKTIQENLLIVALKLSENDKILGTSLAYNDPKRYNRGEAPDVNPNYKGQVKLVKNQLTRVSGKRVMQLLMTIAWQAIATNPSECFQIIVTKGSFKRNPDGSFATKEVFDPEIGANRMKPILLPDTKTLEFREEFKNIIDHLQDLKTVDEYIQQGNQLLESFLKNPNSVNLHPAEKLMLNTIITPHLALIKANVQTMTQDPKKFAFLAVLNSIELAREKREIQEGLPTKKGLKEQAEAKAKAEAEAKKRQEAAAAEAQRIKAEQAAKAKAEAEAKARAQQEALAKARQSTISKLKGRR